MIGLSPAQYKALTILRKAEDPLNEKQVRALWGSSAVGYTSMERKSPVNFELNALVKLGLATKEKQGRSYFYRPKEEVL